MRISCKLPLLAMLATVAGALTASPALAQVEPIAHEQTPRLLVHTELGGTTDISCIAVSPTPAPAPSPLVTSGGCRVHYNGLGIVFTEHEAGGVETILGTCNVEVEMRINSKGEGYWTHQELTPAATGTCLIKACGQVTPPTGEGRAWSFFMREAEPGPAESITLLFCIEPIAGGNPEHCEFTLPVSQPTQHNYRLTAVNTPSHSITPFCELDGMFNIEYSAGLTGEDQARMKIELRHT